MGRARNYVGLPHRSTGNLQGLRRSFAVKSIGGRQSFGSGEIGGLGDRIGVFGIDVGGLDGCDGESVGRG